MTEATPQGASLESAANAIMGLMDAGSEKRQPSNDAQQTEKKVQSTDKETKPIQEMHEDKSEPNDTDVESETPENEDDDNGHYHLPSHIDELANALGVQPDDLFNIKIKTKVDGQDGEVSLAELRKSYQLEKHLNNKSMAFAEQQKAFQAQLNAHQQQMQHQTQEMGTYIKYIENELFKEYNHINWNELRVLDPAEYAAKRQEFNDRLQTIQNFGHSVNQEIQRQQQQSQYEQYNELSGRIEKEHNVLLNKLPEWSNKEKAAAEKTKLRSYLKNSGYDDSELNTVIDHRAIIVARKAMLYDELMQSKPDVNKKVKSLPKFIKQGGVPNKADVRAENKKVRIKQLRRSGNVKDAASLIEDLL
jgi:hypothetical protein